MAFRQMVLEMQRFFPEIIHKIYVVNVPVFFDGIWEDELSKNITSETQKKMIFSQSESCPELLEDVDEYDLPEIYGGQANAKATCVFADKGPWSEVENLLNYQKPDEASDDDDFDECDLSEHFGFAKLKI